MLRMSPCPRASVLQLPKEQHIKAVTMLFEPFTKENGLATALIGDAANVALNRKVWHVARVVVP